MKNIQCDFERWTATGTEHSCENITSQSQGTKEKIMETRAYLLDIGKRFIKLNDYLEN